MGVSSVQLVGIVLVMRRFRTGLIAVVVVVVAVFAVGAVMVPPCPRRATCSRDVAAGSGGRSCHLCGTGGPRGGDPCTGAVSGAVVGAGTVPDNFEPASVVVCQFLEYTDDFSEAVLSQTVREGDITHAVAQLNRESLESPLLGECPTASSIPTPVVWLVDAAGHAVRVAFPVDGTCRLPLPEAYEAVMNLAVQDEQIHRLPRTL